RVIELLHAARDDLQATGVVVVVVEAEEAGAVGDAARRAADRAVDADQAVDVAVIADDGVRVAGVAVGARIPRVVARGRGARAAEDHVAAIGPLRRRRPAERARASAADVRLPEVAE